LFGPRRMLTSSRQVTFRTRGLTKVYGTGDVAVHALRGIPTLTMKDSRHARP
jgi:hypothetical protein